MKNIIFALILCLCASFSLHAQKVKLQKLNPTAKYLSLPTIGFDKNVTAYSVVLTPDGSKLSAISRTITSVKDKIKISGYTKLDEAVEVVVDVALVGPNASASKLVTNEKKTKEGKVYKEYYYTDNCSVKAIVKVIDPNGNLIKDYIADKSKSVSSGTYNSLATLKANNKKNYPKRVKKGKGEALDAAIIDVVSWLDNNFGYPQRALKVEIQAPKNEKAYDYDKWAKITPAVESAFSKMTYADNSEFMTTIQPAIDFWTSMESKYSASDKHLKKMKYACNYNTALAYFWGEDLENAKVYAEKVAKGTHNEKDGERLLKDIEDCQNLFESSGRNTRHFVIDMGEDLAEKIEAKNAERAEAIASGDIRQFPNFKSVMGVNMETQVYPGTINKVDGSNLTGYFVFESPYSGFPDFRTPSKIRFGYAQDGKIVKNTLKYDGIKAMHIDTLDFTVQDVKLVTGIINPKLKNAIISEIKDFEQTTVVIVHPPFMYAKGIIGSQGDPLEPDMFVYHKSRDEHISPEGLTGFKAGMKKIVGDCPEAMAYLETVKEERKEARQTQNLLQKMSNSYDDLEPLFEALKIYDECE